MVIVYLNVFGMKCGMCEAHINDVIRKTAIIKKVKSNHKKNLTIIKMDNENDIEKIIQEINKLGYECNLNSIEKDL